MKTLHQIQINCTTSEEYKTTISLVELADMVYYVITRKNHRGVINEFEERCETYKEALNLFLENVSEYASHTALMNL